MISATVLSAQPPERDKLDRRTMGLHIARRLEANAAALSAQWGRDAEALNYFYLDDLLPHDWAMAVRAGFPAREQMILKESLREKKYIAAQMDRYHPLMEEIVYAFQEPEVVQVIERITGLAALEPDSMLYAGGVSLMAGGHFLNPHVDNSHDKTRERYRVLNLLYYVSPEWAMEKGGNLELWPQGPGMGQKPVTAVSAFNRLVVMVTHKGSWHSVSMNRSGEDRCCVSNYYFSRQPVGGRDYFHVTSFRGRPEQPLRDLVLRGDGWLRMAIRRFFSKGIRETRHFYAKKG